MKYRNTKTGAVIDVNSKISGENWEEIKPNKKPDSSTKPKDEKAGEK